MMHTQIYSYLGVELSEFPFQITVNKFQNRHGALVIPISGIITGSTEHSVHEPTEVFLIAIPHTFVRANYLDKFDKSGQSCKQSIMHHREIVFSEKAFHDISTEASATTS